MHSPAGDPRPDRIARVRAALAASDLDGLVIGARANVRWLTGFTGSAALLVVTTADVVLITDFRYRTQARDEAGAVARVEIEGTSLWSRLWTVLPALANLTRLGFESVHLSHLDHQRILDGGARWVWRGTTNLVEELRQVKDATEVAAIRDAVAIAERALELTVPEIVAGKTELEVGARLEFRLRELGSEAHPFETIVAAGARSALPHARCTPNVLRAGDFVVVDFGAVSGGYCSDITRTFVVGTPSDAQREAYDVVREANLSASAGVRAGMRGRDADAIARDYIERHGLGEEFGHSLGHGIGLEVHEAPRLSKAAEAPLPAWSVVTIEPGVYREGWGGIRVEDDVLLAPDGPVVLTSFPRELRSAGVSA